MSRFDIIKGTIPEIKPKQPEQPEYLITCYSLNYIDDFNNVGGRDLGDISHSCVKCGKSFPEQLLDIIILKNSIDKEYLCPTCAEKFAPEAEKNRMEIQVYMEEKLESYERYYAGESEGLKEELDLRIAFENDCCSFSKSFERWKKEKEEYDIVHPKMDRIKLNEILENV